jgi:hypothetical protein
LQTVVLPEKVQTVMQATALIFGDRSQSSLFEQYI